MAERNRLHITITRPAAVEDYTPIGLALGPAAPPSTSLAPIGELSPFSRTSVGFRAQWPHKPEVVFEGGNAAVSPDRTIVDTPPDLQVLTARTPYLGGRLLTTVSGTSPATAQAAHLATRISSAYPHLWPETIRGPIVHSARWTDTMRAHSNGANRTATCQMSPSSSWDTREI